MRTVYRDFLIVVVVLFPITVVAQPQLNFKRIVNNWPTIELWFTVECGGQRVWIENSGDVRVQEDGVDVSTFNFWTPEGLDCANSTVLVLDASGSMAGSGNIGVKAAGNRFIDLMDGRNDESAIIWYSTSATIAQPMTVYKDLLHNAINALPTSGATAVWDGIFTGVQHLIENGVNPCRGVVAMTDGGDNSSTHSPAEIIALANKHRIRVYTIGLGTSIQSDILQNIADQTGGRFYATMNPTQLIKIFEEISTIIYGGGGECLITYQGRCLDGGTRTVDFSVLNICQGSDSKRRTYTVTKDTSTTLSVVVGCSAHTVHVQPAMAMPIELFTPLPDNTPFHRATFHVRFDEKIVRCIGVQAPPGSLLENVPLQVTPVPGGVTVQTMTPTLLRTAPAPSLLAELLFEAVQQPVDTLCTPIDVESLVFETGCFQPVLSSGRLCFTTSYPDVACTTSGPDSLGWSVPRATYVPENVAVSAHVRNLGRKAARNTRVVIDYIKADFLRMSPASDTIAVTPSTLQPNDTVSATWSLCARPRSDSAISSITFTTLYEDGIARQCTHDIVIPKSEYEVLCTLQAPRLVADFRNRTYAPDPVPVKAIVRNTTTTVQDRLSVELLLPPGIRLVSPDNSGTARKELSPLPVDPGQSATALWYVRSDKQPVDTRLVLECVTRRDTVEICRTAIELAVPALTRPPAPVITPLGSLRLCPGGSVELDAGDGYSSYIWSTGERTRTIVVHSAGMYVVTVTDQYGRRGTAPPIVIAMLPTPAPAPRIMPLNGLRLCEGSYTTLDVGSYAEYLWNSGELTHSINVRTAGTWWVRVKSAEGCYGYSDTVRTTVVPAPVKPTITRSGDTLMTQQYRTYQWYKDGTRISGAVQQSYVATSKGGYQVHVTNEYGCLSASDIIDLILTGLNGVPVPGSVWLDVYPNPVTNELTVTLRGTSDKPADIRLVSVLGQTITGTTSRKAHGEQTVTYDLSSHPAGLYFVTAAVQGRVLSRSVVKR
ncbi:MAG: VWA domain-containing protein [Ignavibacteriae bacterium]|nr:VWA domain-containing protein [Ignavibacteriota bacterium]